MKFTAPTDNQSFTITNDPAWPSIVFKTDATGAHVWNWVIKWKTFKDKGTENTAGNSWDAKDAIKNRGGILTVTATAAFPQSSQQASPRPSQKPNPQPSQKPNPQPGNSAKISVKIIGTNPSATQISSHLGDCKGYDKLLSQEAKCKHFSPDPGEPIKSSDNGYGMAQLTTPPPTFEQVWNWKLNISKGYDLFKVKIKKAKDHLSKDKRNYTSDQLTWESVCLYNGGFYFNWDDKQKAWVRKNVFCETTTWSNWGWDMDDPDNAGKKESDLKQANKKNYGVCYADQILGGSCPAPQPSAQPSAKPTPHASLWFNSDGELVHPDAPAGGGGPGFFRLPGPQYADHFVAGLPDPRSPHARTLDPLELDSKRRLT